MIIEPRATRHRRERPRIGRALFAVLVLAFAVWVYCTQYMPNWRMAPIPDAQNARLVIRGKEYDERPMPTEHGILLSLDTIRTHFDPNVFWDEDAQSVTVTTENRVIRMRTESLTAFVNRVPQTLKVPAISESDAVYVPMEILEPLYRTEGRFVEASGTVFYDFPNEPFETARVRSDNTPLRAGPSKDYPITVRVSADEKLRVASHSEGWLTAITESGHFGYVPSRALSSPEVVRPESGEPPKYLPPKPDGKINLTWEHVLTKNPDTSTIGDMPGLNVVSPTWFEMCDDSGQIKNKADMGYVNWAHERGYKVWALVDNGFDPERTSVVLRDPEKRESVIVQLLAYAALCRIDGVNIDFENVYYEDRDHFTQFVRELAALAREQGLAVSIDVTVKSTSPTWSMFYDRRALAEAVDFVMLMAYDEHPSGSRVAGSVSSLSWTEAGLRGVLEEVPAEKLVLGMPFYTRVWREEMHDGASRVSSQALGMATAESLLLKHSATVRFDAKTGQRLGTYEDSGAHCKVWLEDADSIAARVALVEKYGLAGIASWRRGFEKPEIWSTIAEALENLD